MARNIIGPKIGIEGEKEFRNAINQINGNMRTLGSEMKVVTSQFDRGDKSQESYTAKSKVLNKQVDEQKSLLDQLTKGLEKSTDKYGENDATTQKWQQSVNKATAELNNTERELKKTTDAAKHLNKEKMEKFTNGLKKSGEIAAKMALAIAAASAAAAVAIAKLASSAAEAADEIHKGSQRMGVSSKAYQELSYWAGQNGLSHDDMEKAVGRLNQRLGMAAAGNKKYSEVLEKLGVDMDGVRAGTVSTEEAFATSIQSLSQMTNEQEKAALASELFGTKLSRELLPALNDGSMSIEESTKFLEDMGIVMSEDMVNAGAAFSDSLDNLKTLFGGLKNLIGGQFFEPLTNAMDKATEYVGRLSRAFNEGGFSQLAEEFIKVRGELTEKLLEYMPELIELGAELIQKLAMGFVENIPALLKGVPFLIETAITLVTELARGFVQALPVLIPAALEAIFTVVDSIINNLDMLIDTAVEIIVTLANGLIEALPVLIEKAPEIIISLVTALITNAPKLIEASLKIVSALVAGLIGNIPTLIKAIPTMVKSMVNAFVGMVPDFKNVGIEIVKGLWNGIQSMVGWLKNKIGDFVGGIVNGVKGVLGIKSPSRVFSGIGENMALGLGQGFEASIDVVAKRINNSVPKSVDMSGTYSIDTIPQRAIPQLSAMTGGSENIILTIQIDGQTLAHQTYENFRRESKLRGTTLLQGV